MKAFILLLLLPCSLWAQRIGVTALNEIAYFRTIASFREMDSVLHANYFNPERGPSDGFYYRNEFGDIVSIDVDVDTKTLHVSMITKDQNYFDIVRESVRTTYPLQTKEKSAVQIYELYTCKVGLLQVGRENDYFFVTRITPY